MTAVTTVAANIKVLTAHNNLTLAPNTDTDSGVLDISNFRSAGIKVSASGAAAASTLTLTVLCSFDGGTTFQIAQYNDASNVSTVYNLVAGNNDLTIFPFEGFSYDSIRNNSTSDESTSPYPTTPIIKIRVRVSSGAVVTTTVVLAGAKSSFPSDINGVTTIKV